MAKAKIRYKAVIANQSYTIIGQETSQHMDRVTRLVNEQLQEIRQMAPQTSQEEAAILLAVNAISDQLKKQEELLTIREKMIGLKEQALKSIELENRLKRIEAIEIEAKEVLERTGRGDVEIRNHMEAQQILNEERKRTIQNKTAKR
ncbi:cell division protein ZapA [Enterococcus aquimarinus]|uniref:Cell division protein ZapA n=1 Tax=Enterococcus aquimarinus TaxID=328396 RepID=A0A1L8QVK8_9ENTE|nr:cell division protein ZapA [Enterococcus aquimarinus]MBP6359749.1 cell division protein ZapA [Enterococcus sp.]MBP7086081.1 cell division protein ZapA [Enterococcus sp.]MBP7953510.1 cell division protein ZapA [Enterococcus sp.]MBP8693263.1 cell division protein ZapA [Enterococcus sp.]MBP9521053.1 cell division protein ZapA [Enterococcus sp.]